MASSKSNFNTKEELQKAILQEKLRGISDIEIGRKYGVSFKYIERLITQTQGVNVSSLVVCKKIKTFQPKEFKEEQTTVWSFKQRGNWATHSGEYRGNWSPYIPRNVILKYSKPDEVVLDYFCGAGTTAIECKLLGRKCIAIDINPKAIELAKKNIDFNLPLDDLPFSDENHLNVYEPELLIGDARNLSFLEDNSVDLICAHPPYANILHYTDFHKDDLSFLDIDEFFQQMSKVAKESFRVLKPGRQCAILIGDMRKKKHVIPLGFKLINVYLEAGFKLRELIIKRQHNCKTTGFWYLNSIRYNFLLLAHEYLPIFEKPKFHPSLNIKENGIDYAPIITTLEKPHLKRKLEKLETTTVWVLPEKDFEEYLDQNVINRYSNNENNSTLILLCNYKNNQTILFTNDQKNKNLLYLKTLILKDNISNLMIDVYLHQIKEIIIHQLPTIVNDGFVVIQTQDVRINEHIEPIAKRLVDILTLDYLQLKEIIIVTKEEQNSEIQTKIEYLKINHQYLLVYRKINRDTNE